MQNSTVISRVNAGLSRCLSHHRRLCRGIAELDRLIYSDEFLKDPRTQWLLQQRRLREEDTEMGRLIGQSGIKNNLSVSRAFCQLLQAETPRSRAPKGPLPAPTPQPSPERRPSLRFPRPERKASSSKNCQSE
ncbi:uncharacterized protein [Drosophila takahashii]|uniref:uncharacterized protein n=1 Tax=Drosophila takahashii TaxID=29030 RepID=UPI001CF7EE12|nr:uncharacterized protein LOC108060977 [Drosophila takahashii]